MSTALLPALAVAELRKDYVVHRGFLRRGRDILRAVDGVSLAIARGETLGLVGESGCGKTTLGRLIVRLIAPSSGRIRLDGQDVTHLPRAAVAGYRRKVQMVFQDPYSSLNPRMTAGALLREPFLIHDLVPHRDIAGEVMRLLGQVGLPPDTVTRYPHEFSGGQRQRLAIARALAVSPEVVVADEPVSALDVSIRAQVLNLLADLQQARALAYLFISHDIAVVAYLSHRIAVMYLGAIVETGPAREVLRHPQHPYTEMLLTAAPAPHPRLRRRTDRRPTGEVAPLHDVTAGCRFAARCPIAVARCRTEPPALRELAGGHFAACHMR
jgi:peptide/nickel transport system ATP-binding protein/oligopeptide transport system ATP-binding protein